MNKLLATIEKEGMKYGLLKLNKTKCEFLQTGNDANAHVHFANGDNVKRQEEVKYLGCFLNQKAEVDKEIKKRIATCMTILRSLDLFWRHSDCPVAFKLIAQDAVIRAKLLYGLESAELKQAQLKQLDVFQLKGLRKILRLETTFINRANSNKRVFEKANEHIRTVQQPHKRIKPYSEVYQDMKHSFLCEIIRGADAEPTKYVTFNPTTFKLWDYGLKRSGAPRKQWFNTGKQAIWQKIKPSLASPFKHQDWKDTPHRIQKFKQSMPL